MRFVGLFVAASLLVGPDASATTLELWLRADVGVTTSGSSVATWSDQSGRGNDVSQSTAINRPELVSGGLNGNPVVQFSGQGNGPNDDDSSPDKEYLVGNLSSPVDLNRATVFAVGSIDPFHRMGMMDLAAVAGSYGYMPLNRGHRNGLSDLFSAHYDGDGSVPVPRLQCCHTGTSTDSAHHIYASQVNKAAADMDIFLDGIDLGVTIDPLDSSTVPLDDVTHVTIGALQAGNIWWFGGDIAEVMVFDDVLTSDQLTGMTHILGDRWGLTVPTASAFQIASANALLPAAIPEPSTALLLGVGLAGFGMRRRRTRSEC